MIDLCRALDWFAPGQYRTSPRAKPAALAAWHDAAYIAALEQAENLVRMGRPLPPAWVARFGLGTLTNPGFPEMFRRPATGAGGSLLAAELLLEGGVVHVPGAGTHHGMPDRANGFCYLNDVVLGILALRRQGIRRIAYVDIDAHHCDGVEAAFAGNTDILMISVHEVGRWPFTGKLTDSAGGSAFNLPVSPGFNDTEARLVLDRLILPRVAAHRAEAIVLQCGADALLEDPLSRLALSNNAHRAVLAGLRPLAPRLMVLGGGGYNPWSVARLWALIWADLAGHTNPVQLPEPALAILRALTWSRKVAPAPHLMTSLADPAREGQVRANLIRDLDQLENR